MFLSRYILFSTLLFLSSYLPYTIVHAQQVVRVETVQQHALQQHYRITGNLHALSAASLAVRESGYVAEVFVNEGARVKVGDLLLQLDERRLQAELTQLQAELGQARAAIRQRQAELANAKVEMEADQYSARKKAISQREFRSSKTQVSVAQASFQEAQAVAAARQAQIELLQVRIADLRLHAPFDGLITERLAEPGEWFNQGQNAIGMVADSQLEAWLDVPERFVKQINTDPQQKIDLRINDQHVSASGQVTVGKVDTRARTFTLIARFDNHAHHWMPGMSVLAWLPLGEQQSVLTVGKNALVQRNDKYSVYKVTAGDKGDAASIVAVDVLFYQNDRVAIAASGLADGDRVVSEGNERLMPGPVVIAQTTEQTMQDGSNTLAQE